LWSGGQRISGVAEALLITGGGQQVFAGNTASDSKPVPGNPLLNGEPATGVRAPFAAMLKPLIRLLRLAV